jgi:hypothetical protein
MPLTQVKTSNLDTTNSLFFRNRIINGDMRIDQRNAGAAVSSSTSTSKYVTDRWLTDQNGGGSFNTQQVTDAPDNFNNSLKVTVTGTTSSYNIAVRQGIEGYNIADLAWGTAAAKTVTISFWVKASVAGIYPFSIRIPAQAWYATQYTISQANTWEYKSVTIAGPTSTYTPNKDNTAGFWLYFLQGGVQDTPGGSWNNTGGGIISGSVNLMATNGATWQLTGVQMEVGTAATAFERRPYGTELQLCQRYCWSSYTASGNGGPLGTGAVYNTTLTQVALHLPVPMRTTPSATTVANGSSVWCTSYVGASGTSTNTAPSIQTDSYNYQNLRIAIDGLSGMTAGQSTWTFTSAGAKLILSAEL